VSLPLSIIVTLLEKLGRSSAEVPLCLEVKTALFLEIQTGFFPLLHGCNQPSCPIEPGLLSRFMFLAFQVNLFHTVDTLPAPESDSEKLIHRVIAEERKEINVLDGQSLRGYNEAFLKAHAGELLAKIGTEITKMT
jgi:hypothetical protein